MHSHPDHAAVSDTADRRLLALSLALLLGFMVAEVVFGIVAHSLALLADAGHMLTDAAALALALVAASLAARPAGGRWTFGFGRVEILAAQINGLTLLLFGVWIVYEAIRRLLEPPEVDAGTSRDVCVLEVTVDPGHSTGVHAHHGDEHHLVLSGRWRMTQGDHTVELGPGDYLAWDPAVPHDVENVSDTPASMLVIYPRRGRRPTTEDRARG